MEVLLEYRGSRRQITVSSSESLTECVTAELVRVGRAGASVHTANVSLNSNNERDVYILQKWSPQWDCYVDVRHVNEVSDGDRLTVIGKPRPPSKILRLLCCCCSSPDSGVVMSQKRGVSKNEEIQALDYRFAVDSDTHSNWDSQSVTPTEEKAPDDEQYVRDRSGRASWKMVPIHSQDSSEQLAEEDSSIAPEESLGNSDDTVGEKDGEEREGTGYDPVTEGEEVNETRGDDTGSDAGNDDIANAVEVRDEIAEPAPTAEENEEQTENQLAESNTEEHLAGIVASESGDGSGAVESGEAGEGSEPGEDSGDHEAESGDGNMKTVTSAGESSVADIDENVENAVGEPTREPEEPTCEPEESTHEPEEPTREPEESTHEPEEPTHEPEEPTHEPEEPTHEPATEDVAGSDM